MREEGWYRDPYGLHTDRWYSDGQPTRLVRDGSTESYDDPPPHDPPAPPEPVPDGPGDASDTKRADAASRRDQPYDPKAALAAIHSVDSVWLPALRGPGASRSATARRP
jgi:hypothetical protein